MKNILYILISFFVFSSCQKEEEPKEIYLNFYGFIQLNLKYSIKPKENIIVSSSKIRDYYYFDSIQQKGVTKDTIIVNKLKIDSLAMKRFLKKVEESELRDYQSPKMSGQDGYYFDFGVLDEKKDTLSSFSSYSPRKEHRDTYKKEFEVLDAFYKLVKTVQVETIHEYICLSNLQSRLSEKEFGYEFEEKSLEYIKSLKGAEGLKFENNKP